MSTLKVNSISPRVGTKLSITGSIESTQPILSASHALQADAALTAVTASYAVSASHEIVLEVSSSHAVNADIAPFSGLTGKPTLLSGSTQIASEISGSFGAPSASLASRIVSNDSDIASLQLDSGSFSTRVTNLETFSSSLNATYATDAELAAVSGALATDLTIEAGNINALQTDSGSFSTRVTTNEGHISALHSFTGSLDATYATDAQVATAVSGLNAATSSYALASNLSVATASIAVNEANITNLTSATSSYAASATHISVAELKALVSGSLTYNEFTASVLAL